jgi:hypothetical protein
MDLGGQRDPDCDFRWRDDRLLVSSDGRTAGPFSGGSWLSVQQEGDITVPRSL